MWAKQIPILSIITEKWSEMESLKLGQKNQLLWESTFSLVLFVAPIIRWSLSKPEWTNWIIYILWEGIANINTVNILTKPNYINSYEKFRYIR